MRRRCRRGRPAARPPVGVVAGWSTRQVVDAGAHGRAHRRAAGRRPPGGAHAGPRRGRPRPARPLVQQDGADLQRQIRQLEELSRVQRRFVSDVSHELRTPLTTVRMAADVLYEARRRLRPCGWPAPAELMQSELDRFESLLTDLLEICRFDAGAAVLEAEPSRPADWSSARPRRRAAGDQPREQVTSPPADPAWLEVDPRRIERIMRNLVSTPSSTGPGRHRPVDRRRVAADDALRPPSPCATTASACAGRGGPSSTGSGGPTRRGRGPRGGTGLGLSIALEDAQLHGGWLEAWGRPGGAPSG